MVMPLVTHYDLPRVAHCWQGRTAHHRGPSDLETGVDHSRAAAWPPVTDLRGHGQSRKHPKDANVPEIGVSLPYARRL